MPDHGVGDSVTKIIKIDERKTRESFVVRNRTLSGHKYYYQLERNGQVHKEDKGRGDLESWFEGDDLTATQT